MDHKKIIMPQRFSSMANVATMEVAARRVQKEFLNRQRMKHDKNITTRHAKKYSTTSNHNNVTLRSPISHKKEQQEQELQILEDLVEDIEDQNYIHQLEDKENDDDEEIEMEWRKPSWKRATFVEADSRPHHAGEKMERYNWKTTTTGRHCIFSGCGEQLDLWDEGQLSEFTQFGSGITNYFKFLKWCCWIMLILSVIHLPMAIINTFGISAVSSTAANAAVTTVGNLGPAINVTTVAIPGCNELDYQQDFCNIDKSQIAIFYSFLDAAGTIIVILGWLWLRKFERKEVKNLNRKTVTASDFTICVQNIPSNNTTGPQLAAHFEKITGGEQVADVNLAFDNEKEIRIFFERGVLTKKRYDCVQQIRYHKTMKRMYSEEKLDEKKLANLLQERKRLGDLIQKKDEERIAYVNPFPRALQAFVTFETETGFIKAFSAYQLNWIQSAFCLYPKKLRFHGQRLRVTQAPDPSTIVWENLGFTKANKGCRKFLTTVVAMLAILLSVVATFWATDFQQKMLKTYDVPCPANFTSLALPTQIHLIENDYHLTHCYCSQLNVAEQRRHDQLCGRYLKERIRSKISIYGASTIVVIINTFFTIMMDKAGGFEKHNSLDAMETSIMVRIFFAKFVNTAVLLLLYNMKWLQVIVHASIEFEPNFGVRWYQIAGSSLIIVLILNAISPHISPLLSYYKYRSGVNRIKRNLTDDGETNETGRVWHSQEDLNEVVVGPPFTLNYRYAQTLVTFFACWMYSLSMPVMPLIGAVSFFIQYWVDKFLFCNYYRTPPRYSDSMGRASTNLVALSVIIHLCMSLWMSGRGLIFKPDPIIRRTELLNGFGGGKEVNNFVEQIILKFVPEYLLQKQLVAQELVLIVFVAGILISQAASCGLSQMTKVLRCLICSTGDKVSSLRSMMNTVQVSYGSAKERRIIKGLATYNILQNPKYQEAFAITDEFAEDHNLLSDIQGRNTKEGSLCSQPELKR